MATQIQDLERRKREALELEKNQLLQEILNDRDKLIHLCWGTAASTEDREALWHLNKAIQLIRSDINAAIKRWTGDGQQPLTAGE